MLTSDQMISTQEKAAFEANGFHVVRGVLTPAQVAAGRQALLQTLQTPPDHPYAPNLARAAGLPTHPDNPCGVWAGFDLPLFDDLFYDLAFHPRIALTVDALIGPDINLYETSFVSKAPGFPGDFRDWHQDSEYSDPQSDDRNVTAILCLDDMDGDSGATWVAPGTHRRGAIPHRLPQEAISSRAREVENKAEYDSIGHSFSMQAGDALIFLARLVHKSGANRSDRLQLSLAYNYVCKNTLDLQNKNRYIGAGVPIVRAGRIYAPSWE